MEYFRAEVKTGIAVLACVFLLIVLIIGINGTKTFGKASDITVLFKDASGIDMDAPVNYAGFEAGRIMDIRIRNSAERILFPEYSIAVTLRINSNAIVKKDSVAEIKTLGYMGLKYIDISSGSPGCPPIEKGDIILGYTPGDINDIIDYIGTVLHEMNPKIQKILDGLESVAGPGGTLPAAISGLQKLVDNADDVVVANKEDIRHLIANLKKASANLEVFAHDIKDNPWKLLIKTRKKKESKKIQPRHSHRR